MRTYGASNVDEAFAEVFAHYVLEFDMTRDQVESFRSALSSMAERVVRRFNQEQRVDRRFKTASRYAYHGTRQSVLGNLSRNGLLPGAASSYGDSYSEYDDGRHLFFTDDPEWVRGYYGDTILRFPWPSDAKPDQNKYGRMLAHQFVSKKKVPASDIEVEVGQDWQPLEAVTDRQANVVPFKPKTPTGPTLVIGGRKYALSNYWSMMEGLEDASDGARLILPEEPTNKFRYLWAFDTDKRVLGMWRVSDGDEKAFGRENQHSRDIVVLEKRKQLNRVTTEEFRTIERFMRGRQDDALASMKKYLEENADEWDRESKRLVEEFFKKSVEPKVLAKFREIEQGVLPFGFKPNESHRPPLEAAKMHVAMAILGKEFTLKAVDDFVRTKGIDPDNPPGDIQALDWARQDVTDTFYDAHFPHLDGI